MNIINGLHNLWLAFVKNFNTVIITTWSEQVWICRTNIDPVRVIDYEKKLLRIERNWRRNTILLMRIEIKGYQVERDIINKLCIKLHVDSSLNDSFKINFCFSVSIMLSSLSLCFIKRIGSSEMLHLQWPKSSNLQVLN